MKRIVICLDGTWDQVGNPKTVTNVVRIGQAIKPRDQFGVTQLVYYNSGVGTGDFIDRVLGGAFGRGIKSNVKRAYAFLSLNYEPLDEMYIFGFSRGAYTARALAGLIGASGILRKEAFQFFDVAWNHYRIPPERRLQASPDARDKFHEAARVRCVGVWDTVGSYGIPAGFGLTALSRYFTSWQRGFHNTHFDQHVDVGLQALAIDECRRPFSPTFWTAPKGEAVPATVEQVWFCGVHANVGGGYDDPRLSQLPLIWMIARMRALCAEHFQSALEFDNQYLRSTTDPSPFGTLYRSDQYWLVSRVWPFRRPVLASDAEWDHLARWNGWDRDERPINERVHWSVPERLGQEGAAQGGREAVYSPPNVPHLQPGQVARCTKEESALLPVNSRQAT